jgi:hydroxymethylpyrimidine/phosphomethylpyrimidine kinase
VVGKSTLNSSFRSPPVGLTIAGFDPSSGAGITADLLTFAAHGIFGTSVITALTVQSTRGVAAVELVRPDFLRHSLEHLWADLPPEGIKIGMLGNEDLIEAITTFLEVALPQHPSNLHIPIVLDPVLRASSGAVLTATTQKTLSTMRKRLFPLISWITPNWSEISILTEQPVHSTEDAVAAARSLGRQFPHLHIVVTGGELAEPEDLLLLPGGSLHRFRGEHITTNSTHGTGCAFSTALISLIIKGNDPVSAVQGAKDYTAEALKQNPHLGSAQGPLGLLWPFKRD